MTVTPQLGHEQIQIALRESELRLQSLVNCASMVLWSIDSDGVFIYSEGKGLEALGLRPGAVVGRSVFEVYADVPRILEDTRRALRGEEFTSVTEIAGAAFESRYTPLLGKDGTITGVIGIAVDITQRCRAEEEQSRTLSLLRATLESTTDGILVVDSGGRIASFNQKFAEMWLLPAEILDLGDDEAALGHALSQLRDPEDFLRKVRELYASPEEASFDVLRLLDGRVFERYSQPQRIGQEIIGRVWSFRDVTRRTQVLEELRQRERQLEQTQRLAKLGSWEWDVETNRVTWSRELFRIYEVEPNAAETRFEDYLARVHPDDRRMVQERLQSALAEGGTFEFVERIVRPSGEIRVLRSQGEVIRDDAGRPQRMLGACHDITAHKEVERLAEIAERERREKTALLESTSEGIYVVDLRGRCTFVNPAALRMLGYAPEECMGQNMHQLIHHTRPDGTPYPEEECFIFQAFREGRGVRAENEVLWRKDGTAFPAFYSSSPIRQDGVVEGAVITFADITDLTAAEQALRRAKEEAENASRAKSEFLSRMSHELRTPMNSILGFGQLLERKDLPPDQRKSVEHILKAGRHLLNLINEVLEISRIEAGRQSFSLEPVRVATVLLEANSLIQPLASQREISLERSHVDADLYIRADRQRLVQVLLNLLSNAVKYNRPQGRVTLRCVERVHADGTQALRIGIRDTGRGIPAEKLDRLFIPFERLGAEQSQEEGTGLGLALSKRLVEAMDGTLSVESTAGEGSTFWIELARVDPPHQLQDGSRRAAIAAAAPVGALPATILYIEDNLPNLTLIESILTDRPNITLLSALQGEMGVYLAAEHQPDLVLLDMHLPDIRGDEVLRRLQNDSRTRDTPVVMVSADATASTVARLTAAGAAGYLTKPLDVNEFLATVDRFLGSELLELPPEDSNLH